METTEDFKNEFLKIYKQYITREGSEKLLDYMLNNSDFFVAPASGRRHCSFEGGLAKHSINVYNRLKTNIISEYGQNYAEHYSDETIAIVSLLHDICKTDTYVVDYRNQKIDGKWVQVPYYAYNNTLPYGHGEKSVYIINGFMRLSREEAMAINWHMGSFDARAQGCSDFSLACSMYPLAVLLHVSDLEASYLDEK